MDNDFIKSINLRINDLVNYFSNDNNSSFARLVGTSEANVRNYRADTLPKADFLIKVTSKLEINCEWLLLGKGDMLETSVEKNRKCISCDAKDRLIMAHEERILEQSAIIKKLLEQLK
jgi:hypothetical protein